MSPVDWSDEAHRATLRHAVAAMERKLDELRPDLAAEYHARGPNPGGHDR